MRIVNISPRAQDDLFSILLSISEDSPTHAVRMVARLEKACSDLAEVALHYPLLAHRESEGICRRPLKPYNIFYIVEGERVEVLHVLHGARDYERLFFPDEN